MAEYAISKRAFDQLMNGQVINRHVLDNSGYVPNPIFDEIVHHEDEYKKQYRMSGYQLVINKNYIFLQNAGNDADSLKTDVSMKAYVLLLLIGRYLNTRNYRISKIEHSGSGLSVADISFMEEMPDIREILEKTDMKNSLLSHVKSVLVERNIMVEQVGTDTYILSDAGSAFFQEIFSHFYDS